MATIEFNDKKVSIKLDTIRTVAELIPSIKSNHLGKDEYLTELFINGEQVNSSNQSLFLDKTLSDLDIVQFGISNSKNILLETIDELPMYIDGLISTIDLAVSFSKNEQTTLMLAVLGDIIEKIDSFIQLITQIHQGLVIQTDKMLDSGQTIKQLEIHLLSVAKALLLAKRRNDEVMLLDLLDYELKDNLTQWKITAIPQIKRLNTI
jgi:hypothetical protein